MITSGIGAITHFLVGFQSVLGGNDRVRLINHEYRVGWRLSKSKELSITLSSFLQSFLRFEVWKKNFKPNPLNWVMEFDVQTPKVAIFETSTIHVSN